MRILLSIPALLFALSASAQFSVTTDTNGLLNVGANTRSTNFFRTNMVHFERAARGVIFNNQIHTNAALRNSTSDGLYMTNSQGSLLDPALFVSSSGIVVVTNQSGGSPGIRFDNSDPDGTLGLLFNFGGANYWSFIATTNTMELSGPGGGLVALYDNTVKLGDIGLPVEAVSHFISSLSANFANVTGSNYLSGRFAKQSGTYSSLVNGNNAAIPTGTNSVLELSGGTTISQIAGFAATGEGDEFEARFVGAVTNWIVNEANSAFSTDAVAANRIKTGTGGDITLTNQPAWAKFRYKSSRWELMFHSR